MIRSCRAGIAALSFMLVFSLPAAVQAVAPHVDGGAHRHPVPMLKATADGLEVTGSLLLDAQREPGLLSRTTPFRQRHGQEWDIRWDSRGDRAAMVQGQGIPLLPGRGNELSSHVLSLSGDLTTDLSQVAALARAFIDSEPELLTPQRLDLRLDRERSTAYGPERERWFLEFQQHHRGIPVDGAFVHVRIVHGNIVQFGAERVGEVLLDFDKSDLLDAESLFENTWRILRFPAGTQVLDWLQRGELRVYPVLPAGQRLGESHSGLRGLGYDHILVWKYVFRVDEHSTWQVLVDARDGRVHDVRDLTVHADAVVRGGVYPSTNTDTPVTVEFPFTTVSNNGTQITDVDGVYDYSGGTATVTLNGRYFRMSDRCGSISLSSNTDGNIDFGSSGGTDCTTPGFGGAGNTHASRSGFYHLTLINAKARSLLPDNTWLQSTVTANMNINAQCNASWGGGQLNFYRSGGGCSNTGEIAAVFLHEWGHGIDTNTGGTAPEFASGEAVGDTFAFLEMRDSCIGPNFRPGVPCHNCTSCTGVRDVGDFALGGARPLATPANITHADGINCGRFICPFSTTTGTPYRGPMGYQGHCESLIASTANWDLKNALLDEYGEDGWSRMDQIWYGSLVPSKSAYRVASGGQCNTSASVDGCGPTNWYTVFLAVDDDDGNLANGTPNGCRIWDAFDAHGIACGARPACTEFGSADFSLEVEAPEQAICAGQDAAYTVQVGSLNGFDAAVTLALAGQPATSSVTFSNNPVQPGEGSILTLGNTMAVAPGHHSMLLSGSAAGSDGREVQLGLQVDVDAAGTAVPVSPPHDAIDVSTAPTLSWQAAAGAGSYRVELALDATFQDIVFTQADLTVTEWQTPPLQANTRYYWRVIASNGCGDAGSAPVHAFTTETRYCSTPNVPIPDNSTTGVTDTISIDSDAEIESLRLYIRADHTYVGDLGFRLSRGPATALVIDRPGHPASTWGCSGDHVDVVLDDKAELPVEDQCAASPPAITGELRPNQLMTPVFSGGPLGGDWSLTATDAAPSDTGTLLEWCLEPVLATDTPRYVIGGQISGLLGSGLSLRLNEGEPMPIDQDGVFSFPDTLPDGSDYEVDIATLPSDPAQTCTLANASGTLSGADVDDIEVRCIERIFYDGFEGP